MLFVLIVSQSHSSRYIFFDQSRLMMLSSRASSISNFFPTTEKITFQTLTKELHHTSSNLIISFPQKISEQHPSNINKIPIKMIFSLNFYSSLRAKTMTFVALNNGFFHWMRWCSSYYHYFWPCFRCQNVANVLLWVLFIRTIAAFNSLLITTGFSVCSILTTVP